MFMRVFLGSHIPEETIRIAHAAFPKGNVCTQMRDALGSLYTYCMSRRNLRGGRHLRVR